MVYKLNILIWLDFGTCSLRQLTVISADHYSALLSVLITSCILQMFNSRCLFWLCFLFDAFVLKRAYSGLCVCAANEYSAAYPFGESVEAEEIVPLHTVEPEQEYQPHSADLYHGSLDERPPEDFQVVAIDSKDVPTKPEASTLSTHKLFIDTTVFEHVDIHALEVCFCHICSFWCCCLLISFTFSVKDASLLSLCTLFGAVEEHFGWISHNAANDTCT